MIDRVLVVGSGSAGRRHLAELRRACPQAAITVVRRPDSTSPEPVAQAGVSYVADLGRAIDEGPQIAAVASPAPWHRGAVTALLAAGATVLVEKPIAASVDDAVAMAALASADRRLVVGYHLRWHEVVLVLQRAVRAGRVGTPTGFDLRVGQHLAQWRPGADPTRSVTARAELGGGVLLELSHELDGLRFLLGEVDRVSATLAFDGAPTDGRVDTVADLEVHTASGATGRVHLDMVAAVPFRRWEVTGPGGRLVADLLDGRVELEPTSGDAETLLVGGSGRRDEAEARLVSHLLDVREDRVRPGCSAVDGLQAVRLVALAIESHRRSAAVDLPPWPPSAVGFGAR